MAAAKQESRIDRIADAVDGREHVGVLRYQSASATEALAPDAAPAILRDAHQSRGFGTLVLPEPLTNVAEWERQARAYYRHQQPGGPARR